jgi:transcriptional regulator of nitric oxide reductase
MVRAAAAIVGIMVALSIALTAQKRTHGFIDPMPTAALKRLFPAAMTFTPRGEEPPHFTAYAVPTPAPNAPPLGYAFWTIDTVPEAKGYHGHIHMLIGLDLAGRLTGVIVDVNTEPYGNFSVEPPAFAAQFAGKSIRDPFIVGKDVNAVSRATITMRAAAQSIRDSARLVARAVLKPEAIAR